MAKPGERVEFANTLRGVAAICVVVAHYFGLFWYSPQGVAALTKSAVAPAAGVPIYIEWLQPHPYFNWGSFGVALFFMVSGFVIPGSLAKMTAGAFLNNRVIRILPTYVSGFLICLTAIAYNLRVQGLGWPFPVSHTIIHFIPGLRDIMNTTPIDGIVWTLEIEVKFYLMCALVAPLFAKRSAWVFAAPAALAIAVLAASALWAPGADMLAGRLMISAQYIIFMFAGSAFYYAHAGAMPERQATLIATLLVGAFVLTWHVNSVGVPLYLALNYIGAFLTFWAAFAFPWLVPVNRVTGFFAKVSYPLYVVHGVAGYTLLLVLLQNGFRASAALVVTTAAALGLSYALHVWVEKPTQLMAKGRQLSALAPAE